MSWMQLGLDALGVLPGIGLFGKGVKTAKVVGAAARAEKAAAFGKGFEMTDVVGFISKPGSNLANRLANVSNGAYHQGQWLGTRGIKLLSFNKLSINALSGLSTGFDAGLKLIPKVISIPQHYGEAVHLGDRFHKAAEAK